ncbi:MAG: clostripain-related cysteine peptidase [Ferruginibacter sp.]
MHENTEKYDWLLVFFVHEISEYKFYLDKLLDIIKQSGKKSNIDVWVLLDKAQKNVPEDKATFELEVLRLAKTKKGTQLIKTSLQEFNISKSLKRSWITVLEIIFKNIRTKRRILFTWSHGAGFGINVEDEDKDKSSFVDDTAFLNKIKSMDSLTTELSNKYFYATTSEIQKINDENFTEVIYPIPLEEGEYQLVLKDEQRFNCKKLEILWMSDLADCLRASLNEETIDVMIMMNCNMQLFENGFMLKDVVKILIGPESQMWVDGYDYKKLLSSISENPKITNKALSKKVLSDYIKMHKKLRHQYYLDHSTMFVNSLKEYERITSILQKVTQNLLCRMGDVKGSIQSLQQNFFFSVSGRDTLFLLDLGLWIETVFSTPGLFEGDLALLDEFRHLISKTVIAKHVGHFFIQSDADGPKRYGYTGSSLFFPFDGKFTIPTRLSWCEYFSEQINSSFQNKTLWDEFIRKLVL